ncbi:hypothetical protein REPUB_Repub16aG0070900 [Reevesia pubescens]
MLDAFVKYLRRSGRMGEVKGLIKDMMCRGLSLDQETIEKNIPFDVVAYNVLINGVLRLGKYEAQSIYVGVRELVWLQTSLPAIP